MDNDDRDQLEEFPISNLLQYFQKSNIAVDGIFSFEGRIIFLLLQFINSGVSLFLYIPSKYFLKPDNSVKNYLHISLKQTDDEEKTNPSFFIVNKQDNKKKYEASLTRFIPIMEDSKYKIVYINKEFLVYINRYDSIDSFTFNSPFNKKGYYFVTDLEHFYEIGDRLEKEIVNTEMLFSTKVYNSVDNELPTVKEQFTKLIGEYPKMSGRDANARFNSRLARLGEVIEKFKKSGKTTGECLELSNGIRQDNFNNIFYYEKIIFFLKELKDDI